jgi:hypothetical protein
MPKTEKQRTFNPTTDMDSFYRGMEVTKGGYTPQKQRQRDGSMAPTADASNWKRRVKQRKGLADARTQPGDKK